jgi:hypothetical protein
MPNQTQVWRPAQLEGVEAKRGERVTHSHPNHWHDELHLVLIEEGAGVLAYRNTPLPTVAGSFFVVPPGEVHANYATEETGCSFRTVNLRLEALEGWEEFQPQLATVPVGVTCEPEVVGSFRALHQAFSQPESRLAAESKLLGFLEVLCRTCATRRVPLEKAGREPAAVRAVQEYLNDHLDRNVSLAELATLTQLSPYHLARVFKRAVGLPPHAYQNGMRVQRSGRLTRLTSRATSSAWSDFLPSSTSD